MQEIYLGQTNHQLSSAINLLALFLSLSFLSSCKTEPAFDISTDEFILQTGFEIEAIAAEPLLDSPVALAFDGKGRIWAAELPGYMRDIDGSDEDEPDGKIVILSDENGDGKMGSRQIFLDGLIAPRTLLHAYGGLLYSNGTALWWAKFDDDAKVVNQVLVDSLYVFGGNIEHQSNGLLYNIDNWIYSANSNVRYRLQRGEWLREVTLYRGQWGISVDVNGRLYYNNNSIPIATDYTMPNQLLQNPFQKPKFGAGQIIATSRRLFAYQATAANRGYQDGVLDEENKIKEFTSACSPLIYSGHLLNAESFQNAFVCAPEANLIKRYLISETDGEKSAIPAYDSTEFLISKEETFRPVNLYNAPDGSLYILDLRKGIIQHRAYMTSYLREKILEKGFDQVNGLGRIYRVVSTENKSNRSRSFNDLPDDELVAMLASDFPYERNFAQQELITHQTKTVVKSIKKIALDAENPFGQLHAIWTLEGLDAFDENLWAQLIAVAKDPMIHECLIQFATFFPEKENEQMKYFEKVALLNDPHINRQLAVRLGQMSSSEAKTLLLKMANDNRNDPVLCEAIISGIAGKESAFLKQLKTLSSPDSLSSFLTKTIRHRKANKIKIPTLPKESPKDNRTAGFESYKVHCASCHGLDGIGKESLSPPLVNSEYVSGSKGRLIALVLNGLHGPITVNGKK